MTNSYQLGYVMIDIFLGLVQLGLMLCFGNMERFQLSCVKFEDWHFAKACGEKSDLIQKTTKCIQISTQRLVSPTEVLTTVLMLTTFRGGIC